MLLFVFVAHMIHSLLTIEEFRKIKLPFSIIEDSYDHVNIFDACYPVILQDD